VEGFSDDPITGGRPLLGFRHSNLQRFKLLGVTGQGLFQGYLRFLNHQLPAYF